jgi:hypothetical protein
LDTFGILGDIAFSKAKYERKPESEAKLMECSFKLSHYSECIERAIQMGYKFYTFSTYEERNEQCIIMRHDIDFSIERALEMAKIEQSLGITATYFVRLHAKTYNPFEFNSYVILQKIKDMGNEIGLHTEALDVAHITNEDPLDIFRREKDILENIIKTAVTSAAEHRDFTGINSDWNNQFFARYSKGDLNILNHPFEDRFYKGLKYISDSLTTWREGCMCQNIGKYPNIQILTHPDWWYHHFYHIG